MKELEREVRDLHHVVSRLDGELGPLSAKVPGAIGLARLVQPLR